jgi:hypothetical protein
MSRVQREENLARLCREIQNIPAPIDQLPDRAKKLSESLFLANSSTFATTLEADRADDGIATPFVSGGLIRPIQRTDPSEPCVA